MQTVIYRKDKNEVLLHTTGNCIQYPITIMENYICN